VGADIFYTGNVDLCEQAIKVGLACPIPDGDVAFSKAFTVPIDFRKSNI
jgi:hypothetical protein